MEMIIVVSCMFMGAMITGAVKLIKKEWKL